MKRDILKNSWAINQVSINLRVSIESHLISDLKDHPTGITMADKNIWSAHAAEIGKLHAIPVDDIDKGTIIL